VNRFLYAAPMAMYEYRCRTCDTTFELRRAMSESNDPVACPEGHPGAVRLLSVFASVGAASGASSAPMSGGGGGGCCGGGCGCR
jgi:putative FmdB family regulatory protein